MKFTTPSVALCGVYDYNYMMDMVEQAARTSTATVNLSPAPGEVEKKEEFIRRRIREGHLSVLRHAIITVEIVCSRRVANQLVRHHAGIDFVQESTRWCNFNRERFGGELTYILPVSFGNIELHQPEIVDLLAKIESVYLDLVDNKHFGTDSAGYLLPGCLKTVVRATGNIEAWRTVITKRIEPAVIAEFRQLAISTLKLFTKNFPVFFADIKF